jgi:GNAT superfamily N-acetyltransferase
MKPCYNIALAEPRHLKALAGIELLAGTMLRGHAPASVLGETTPVNELREAQVEGRLWVALRNDTPVGFALVEMLGKSNPHLQEIDVLPEHGRRGLGTALLQAVFEWIRFSGYPEITLTTFREIPWNMPFYSRLGFEEILVDELRAELKTIVKKEASYGLDPKKRVVMRRWAGAI